MLAQPDRRLFLRYLGAGFTGAAITSGGGPLGPVVEARGPMPFTDAGAEMQEAGGFTTFGPIVPSDRDDLLLPAGFAYQLLIAYGDRFTRSGERFGFNCDFTAFLPRNADGTEGLLFVNHEYVGTADRLLRAGVHRRGRRRADGRGHEVRRGRAASCTFAQNASGNWVRRAAATSIAASRPTRS